DEDDGLEGFTDRFAGTLMLFLLLVGGGRPGCGDGFSGGGRSRHANPRLGRERYGKIDARSISFFNLLLLLPKTFMRETRTHKGATRVSPQTVTPINNGNTTDAPQSGEPKNDIISCLPYSFRSVAGDIFIAPISPGPNRRSGRCDPSRSRSP